MSEQANLENPKDSSSAAEDDEISPLDLLIVLVKHKRILLGFPFITAIVAAIVSLLLPNLYTGTTRILPPQQSASAASAMLSQLSVLGGLGGVAGGTLGIRNPNDLYVGMLKSRTVADSLISRFELGKIYGEARLSDARNRLG